MYKKLSNLKVGDIFQYEDTIGGDMHLSIRRSIHGKFK